MTAEPFLAFLVSLMVAASPPRLHPEPEAETLARFTDTAADLHAVVWEATELPPGLSRHRTAVLLLAIAVAESGLRSDVDRLERRGGGVDACLMQIRPRDRNQAEALKDRKTCFRVGLKLVRQSMNACRDLPRPLQLSAYASGSCLRGQSASRKRWQMAERMWRRMPQGAGS